MPPTFDPFLSFLRRAFAAQSEGDVRAHALWLEAASYLYPTDSASIDRLMLELLEQQDIAQAIALVETAAQLEPHSAAASVRLGYALQMANRHRDALAPYRHALAIEPAFPQLRKNLAIALNRTGGSSEEERQLLEAAVAADPSDFALWIHLMGARRACFDLDGALAAASRAVEIDPNSAVAHSNLAQALKEAQRWDDALTHAATACELAPDNASLRTGLGVLHLLRGNYAEGWPAHEARWNDPASMLTNGRPQFGKPQWRGESLKGKTLLVWGASRAWATCCSFAASCRCSRSVCIARADVSCGIRLRRWARCCRAVSANMSTRIPPRVKSKHCRRSTSNCRSSARR
ncbi:hypothetical protein PPGU19_058670 [Paraburkholderia sp. PGU19]|nr:hypothetical protein PPGU19_058670 [Paraburkholderia sp. PGU19]